ncbi:hypothetical protein [Propionivibrio limicola]|uniref:hypothetical protein n=1 Tax=Propionivibrio limicola TaxID=167645 RepID=UPI00129111BD|nr:hypothetical protein [Propionivibrio limicola]
MGKSNAERQAAYRDRHFKAIHGGLERLNLAVSVPAKAQLERLASCYAVTQREVLETLLAQAERRLLESLPASEHSQYYDQSEPLRSNEQSVTA